MSPEQEAIEALQRSSVLEVIVVQCVIFRERYGITPEIAIIDPSLRAAFCKDLIRQNIMTAEQSVANPVWLCLAEHNLNIPLVFSKIVRKPDNYITLTHTYAGKEISL